MVNFFSDQWLGQSCALHLDLVNEEVPESVDSSSEVKGAWYAIHTAAGNENRIANEISQQFEKQGFKEALLEIFVPKKKNVVVRRGVKEEVEDKILPGYILVRLQSSPEIFHFIRQIPKVRGLLGSDSSGKPKALSDEDVKRLLGHQARESNLSHGAKAFSLGEYVRVCSGLFASMEGVVDEVDLVRSRLRVLIPVFDRPTSVDLEFSQVESIAQEASKH